MAPARFPYAPAPESRAVVNLKPSYGLGAAPSDPKQLWTVANG